MRYSKQREALITLLRSTKTHPDAEWLYTELRKHYPNISLGTVYRNLRQLAQNGEIIEIDSGSSCRFDGDVREHYHFMCRNCGRIYDVDKENVQIKFEEDRFVVESFSLMFTGICNECKNI